MAACPEGAIKLAGTA
ncbi:hypothetical protein AB3X94_04065 [Paraburkholderia sp. BR10923]